MTKNKISIFFNYFVLFVSFLFFGGVFLSINTILKSEKELVYIEGKPAWSFVSFSTYGIPRIDFKIENDQREFNYHLADPKFTKISALLEEKAWLKLGFFEDDTKPYTPLFIQSQSETIVTFADSKKNLIYQLPLIFILGIAFFFWSDTSPSKFIAKILFKKKYTPDNLNSKANLKIALLGSIFFIYVGFLATNMNNLEIVGWIIICFSVYSALYLFYKIFIKK